MADFTGEDLSESRFEDMRLTGAEFHDVDLSNARFRLIDFTGGQGLQARGAGMT